MPDMVCVNDGKKLIQYWALGTDGSDLEEFYVILFSNDYTVIDTTILADLTEAAFPGYASVDVTRASFGAPLWSATSAPSPRRRFRATPVPVEVANWCTGGGWSG